MMRMFVPASTVLLLVGLISRAPAEEAAEGDLDHQRRLCKLHSGEACAQLAHRLLKRSDRDRYLTEAATAYDKACALKVIWACNNVGDQLFYGKLGRPKDRLRAVGYFEIGCEAKDGYACTRLREIAADTDDRDERSRR